MSEGVESSTVQDATERRRPIVLQVLPALNTGGAERGAVDVAQALVEAGGTALVASSGGRMVRELERAGATHLTLPVHSKNPLVMFLNANRLERLADRHDVDIIHARSRAPAWSALRAARRAGRHFITTFHGTYASGGGLKRRYNSIMTRGERVIAISAFIADHLREVYGVESERVRVIHRGVDLDVFDPAKVDPARLVRLASEWRLPDGVPVVMLPGRLARWKGQRVLIEALARLGRQDLCCLLVGSDQGRPRRRRELERLATGHGLASVVRLVGHCEDMPAAYMLADVVVSASTDPEAFGRVVVEAQAMGRPVVASDHGGARETVLAEETGWLFRPGDAGALGAALRRALALDAEARGRLAETAISHIRDNFSKEAMCAKTLAVYAEVMGAQAPGGETAAA